MSILFPLCIFNMHDLSDIGDYAKMSFYRGSALAVPVAGRQLGWHFCIRLVSYHVIIWFAKISKILLLKGGYHRIIKRCCSQKDVKSIEIICTLYRGENWHVIHIWGWSFCSDTDLAFDSVDREGSTTSCLIVSKVDIFRRFLVRRNDFSLILISS